MKKILAGLLCAAILFTACSPSGEVSSPASALESASTAVALEDYPWGDPNESLRSHDVLPENGNFAGTNCTLSYTFLFEGHSSGEVMIPDSSWLTSIPLKAKPLEPIAPPEGKDCITLSVRDAQGETFHYLMFEDDSCYTYQNGKLYYLGKNRSSFHSTVFDYNSHITALVLPESLEFSHQPESYSVPDVWETEADTPYFSKNTIIEICMDSMINNTVYLPIQLEQDRLLLIDALNSLSKVGTYDPSQIGGYRILHVQDGGHSSAYYYRETLNDFQNAIAWQAPSDFTALLTRIESRELTLLLPQTTSGSLRSIADYLNQL